MLGGQSDAILIVTVVMLTSSLVTVSLRCYVRLRIVKAFGWDDGLMVLAMASLNLALFDVAFAICGIIGTRSGIGQKNTYFENRPDDWHRAQFCWFLGQICYILSTTTMRQSIVIQFFRFTFERVHTIVLYVVAILSFIMGVIFFFFTIFQCSPVTYYWKRPSIQGHCLSVDVLAGIAYFYSAIAAVCDLTIGLLPAFLIRHLRASRKTKVGVSVILGIGCVASAAVIVRIPFLETLRHDDILYATSQIAIWSNVEASLGIAAGSLAATRPLYRKFRAAISSLKQDSQSSSRLRAS